MKIFLDTIGCRLNQAEIEQYAIQLRSQGHKLVGKPANADMAIVNTCTVTNAAASDSRKKIRHLYNTNPELEIIVTGCWSTLNPESAKQLPGVVQTVPNATKDSLVPQILNIPKEQFDLEPMLREPIPGSRMRTRAFIKVQDGCDNRCTYCITTIARGPSRSRSTKEILQDIITATSQQNGNGQTLNAKEIVLTGVHLGSWGQDLPQRQTLYHLVKTILKETEVPRIRLSSIEPWDITEELLTLWENPRLCRQLHIPLQSGSAATLRRMARKITPKRFAKIIQTTYETIPDVAITTDVITGFPGETDQEFEESLRFIESMHFAGGHVFTFSPRPGTTAAGMPNQVPFPLRKTRNAKVRTVLQKSHNNFRSRFLGKTLNVLWESETRIEHNRFNIKGLSDNYLKVEATASQPLRNKITPTRIVRSNPNFLIGEITKV